MSGKYLLDTCFIIGLQKHQPDILAILTTQAIKLDQCYYSVISRLELLSYPDLNSTDRNSLQQILTAMTCIELNDSVQINTIKIRQARKVKLSDSIILATAIAYRLNLLTLDMKMNKVFQELQQH